MRGVHLMICVSGPGQENQHILITGITVKKKDIE